MRHVEPKGEYVIEQRRVRFRSDPPWALPGTKAILACKPDVYGLIVRIDDLEAEGWTWATILGKAYGRGLGRLVTPIGSRY